MAQVQLSARTGRQGFPPAKDALSTVVYRSRAVRSLSPPELHELTLTAQSRNGREAITGVMLYDNDHFFQWLEGPPDSVGRLMGSICNDRRHTDIEILNKRPTQARAFGDWSMKLAARVPSSVAWQRDVIKPPREIIENLRRRPEAAPALLVKLVPARGVAGDGLASDSMARATLNRRTAAVLRSVMLSVVIPRLAGEAESLLPAEGRLPPGNPRAPELADLLIAPDQAAAVELINELRAGRAFAGSLYATLFEPAARSLGDLWSEDACSEFDVTLGLCRLQTAARLLDAGALGPVPSGLPQPVVLVTPEPGELHRLGAALDSEVLWNAGWSPQCEYPADDKALQDLVSETWFDVLDLSLSAAFRRERWLPRLTRTIAQARRASRNPALVVIVGGRMFVEEDTAGSEVGADLATRTSLRVDRSILESLNGARPGAERRQSGPRVQVASVPAE
jgi:hypothetical protein